MGKSVDKSNLGYLGIDFQYKLVKCFIEEPNYFDEIYNIVDQSAFTDALLRTFVGVLKDYYKSNNLVPSYEVIRIPLRASANSEIELEEWDSLIDKLKSTSIEGYLLVKENALKFFKQQRIIKAANKILEKAGNGDLEHYEECQKILEDALEAGDTEDLGHSIFELEEEALSNDYTISIPTGIDGLDEYLGGGLDKGKIGLFMAALGVGKTTFSTAIASAAATSRSILNNNEGWKVLQIYFEDDNVDITRKHYSRLTKVEACDIRKCDMAQKEEIREMLNRHPDRELLNKNLKVLKLRTGEVTPSKIEQIIKKLINKGFRPDEVIIDYFECMEFEKGGGPNESEWNKEGRNMRKLENMAKDLNMAIWVTSQGGRDSIMSTIVNASQGSGSIKKQQIVQVIVTAARNLESQNPYSANLALVKNRSGKSGRVFENAVYDNGTSTISCSEVKVYDNALEWKEEEQKSKERLRNEMLRIAANGSGN